MMARKWTEAELAEIVKRSGARLVNRDLRAEPLKLRESLPVADLQAETNAMVKLRASLPEAARGKRGGMSEEQRREYRNTMKREARAAKAPITAALPYPAVQSPSGEQINVSLPYPPSVNHYWLLNRNGSRRISDKGQAFRSAVQARCPGINQIKGEVAISIQAYPPDKRRRDLDNILKSLLDALQHAKLIEDDSNVSDLHIRRYPVMAGGAVIVEIRALGVSEGSQDAQEAV